jgi:hypothetical protein
MTRTDFIAELASLGYEPSEQANDVVTFDYEIQVGRFAGQKIKLAFQLFDDLNPPPGLHIDPPLLPNHPGNDIPHPFGGVHASPLITGWQYWSRPYSTWKETDRSARTFMARVTQLFDFP